MIRVPRVPGRGPAPPSRVLFAVVAALLATAGAGCTKTTTGNGAARQLPGTSAQAPGLPTTGTSSPAGVSAGAGPGTSSAPSPIPAPAACPNGTCKQNMSTTLSAPFAVIVRTNDAFANGAGATILELTESSVPVSWYVIQGERPSQITCSSTTEQSNCVLVDFVGAHGSDGIVFRLSGGTLHRGSTVVVATPETHARDLNGDGWVDVAGLQNNYTPDYVTGKEYWQTWISDGLRLASTGCTAPATPAPPQPTGFVRGNCP